MTKIFHFRLFQTKVPLIACALTLLFVMGISPQGLAQNKRELDHSDYDKWNNLRGSNISNDGNWASFSVSPVKGQGTLTIRNLESQKEYTIKGGSRLKFSFDNKFAVLVVSPDPELLKKLRKEKKKADELPKSKLKILDLSDGSLSTVEGVSNFQMASKAGRWLAYFAPKSSDSEKLSLKSGKVQQSFKISKNGITKQSSKKTNNKEEKKSKPDSPKKKEEKKKSNGRTLVLFDLENGTRKDIPLVKNYRFSEKAKYLAFSTSSVDGKKDGLTVVDLSDLTFQRIISGKGNYGQPVFSKNESALAFLTDKEDYKTFKSSWSLYHWNEGSEEAQKLVDHQADGMPKGWWINSSTTPWFFEDGMRIVFSTKPMPETREKTKPKKKDEKPKAKLDLWHWKDPYLQPQQLLQVAREKNRSYSAVYNVKTSKMVQIADKNINSVRLNPKSTSQYVVGIAADKWRKMRSWDLQSFSDSYLINLDDGKKTSIFKMQRFSPALSPGGEFLTWYNAEKKAYFSLNVQKFLSNPKKEKGINITKELPEPVFNELHDTPSLPGSYGTAGWLKDDKSVLVNTRWDIWQVDPTGQNKPFCLTGNEGKKTKTRFRLVRLNSEKQFVSLDEKQILSVLRHKTKASGYAKLEISDKKSKISNVLVLDEAVGGLRKAKHSDRILLTRSTFQKYPDLWSSSLKFQTINRLSDANPQQKHYLWGSAELVNWKAKDGTDLQGILYKPENFDPKKKYPLMVYFYERNADTLHRYTSPAAGRSIINFSFYVSRGYVVFIPDVVYKTGEPGPSAENCILPGVEHIASKGFVDKKKIGMQGHSWGGYQTAYLVTVTNMFACAESGAPVSNMTSAYGGIRWGTGMSRMFQYEKTQSRIGATLWQDRENYIKNSPVFFADKIQTPLLILHNDKDTAVPWYQGIELFVAMRRLSKPAWMLNYNGDPHWVMSDANRMDFAKRMQQFFDHYLKGDPMPVWMADGIPAVDKGKKFGFEPVKKTKPKKTSKKKNEKETKVEKEASN